MKKKKITQVFERARMNNMCLNSMGKRIYNKYF